MVLRQEEIHGLLNQGDTRHDILVKVSEEDHIVHVKLGIGRERPQPSPPPKKGNIG
jgi:hypothetical protein